MGQEVLDAFWKSNDRIYNENTLLYHRLARACGLPDCAFWLLYTLRSEEAPLTQTQLSEQLSLPKQTVNSALKKLVEEGVLRLEAADGNLKNKRVCLTEAGEAFLRRTVDRVFGVESAAAARLTEEERKARRRTQQEEQRAQQDAQRARREEDRQARLEERRRVPQKQRGSKASETQGGIPRGYLRAAVVFLTMAVLVVLFFIGDMIGWWPGLEDVLRATTPSETAAAQDDSSCTFLNLTPDHLTFSAADETLQLQVAINASCEQPVSFKSSDESIVRISGDPVVSAPDYDQTEVLAQITAVGEGQATITVTCGERKMTCAVTCDFSGSPTDASTEPDTDATEPSEPTTSASFKPELNYSDVTMSLHNETLRVKVTNLPAGKTVKWSSEDEKVAIVDEDGLVTAKGPGVTTITADVGGKTAELIVRCSFEDTAEGGYHLSLTDVTLSVGEGFNLRLLDENDERVEGASYSVKDTTVCTADGSKITGKASGVTRVTVTYYGESFECIIRVK